VDGEREEDVWDGHEEEQDVNRPNLFPAKRHHEDHNAVRYHRNEDWNENLSNIWIWQMLQWKELLDCRSTRKLLNMVLFTVRINTILTTFYYIKQERKCKNFQKKNCFKNVKISKILMFFKIQGGGA
jgi:hypothetical protein